MLFFKKKLPLNQLPCMVLAPDAVTILNTAQEFRVVLLDQIRQAKKRIYLCSLYLQNDEAGQEILSALHIAKSLTPNLDIAVFVDWHRAQRGLIGETKIPGLVAGNAAWYQAQSALSEQTVPIYGVPVQTRELFGVLHLKGFVIDDVVTYSGASLNNVYLHKLERYRHDRYWLIADASLADTLVEFMQVHFLNANAVHRLDQRGIPLTREMHTPIRQFREKLKQARYLFSHHVLLNQTNALTVTPLVGLGKDNPLNRVIVQLIAAAQKQVTICTPYFNLPIAVTREINRALKRGVKIDIIVGDKTANDFFIPPEQEFKAISALPYLYEMNLRRFAKKRQKDLISKQLTFHIWKEAENTYHLKGMWIDQIYTLVTGNNFNPRAFRLDLENALLFCDPAQSLEVRRECELTQIYANTTPINDYQAFDTLKEYPPKVKQLLSRLSRVRLDRLAYRVL